MPAYLNGEQKKMRENLYSKLRFEPLSVCLSVQDLPVEKYGDYYYFNRKILIFNMHLLTVVRRFLIRRFYSYKTVFSVLFNRKK